jgi:DNA-binding CsgD family transcriptional regulator
VRILNVDLVVCDRCTRRVELVPARESPGYGSLVLRAMRAESVGRDLTEREGHIMSLIAAGRSNKEIAREVKTMESTVKVHVKSILRKMRCKNRTQAAMLTRGSNFPPGPEQVSASIEMSADLCEFCVEELRAFMRNGNEVKEKAA